MSTPSDAPAGGAAEPDWLIDADNPLLTAEAVARIGDARRPDRLAWNAFRTLALWDTDVWVPSLLEAACGEGNPLSPLEWSGASVQPWAAGIDLDGVADVVIDGPEALVVALGTLSAPVAPGDVRAALASGLEGASGHGGVRRPTGVVVVGPPDGGGWEPDLGDVTSGWLSWPELSRLALDLAEEGDPLRAEQVRRLVSQVQARFEV